MQEDILTQTKIAIFVSLVIGHRDSTLVVAMDRALDHLASFVVEVVVASIFLDKLIPLHNIAFNCNLIIVAVSVMAKKKRLDSYEPSAKVRCRKIEKNDVNFYF
jgi:hypothetical protein